MVTCTLIAYDGYSGDVMSATRIGNTAPSITGVRIEPDALTAATRRTAKRKAR